MANVEAASAAHASHQSDERNTHQQFLHCDFSFLVSAMASAGAGDAAV
jgi:hypothetical protein